MDEGDLRREIVRLEARIEALAETIERCRKLILIAKAAVAVGGLLIMAVLLGVTRFDPALMIAAMAAVIGGFVLVGSNGSTAQEATAALRAAEAERAELIGKIELHVVGEGAGGNMLDSAR
jgi:hypothetical protein